MLKMLIGLIGIAVLLCTQANGSPISVYKANPYYFQDANKKPIILIGDYTWGTFSDTDFEYAKMFGSLKARGLNAARVWLWWGCEQFSYEKKIHTEPFMRTGPGNALDGRLKYDLTKFNPAFFTRLRAMCKEAKARGINLQLIMMDAWMIKHEKLWKLHAFNKDNNINNVDGDPQGTKAGTDGDKGICSMANPDALKYLQAYVLKVVDTVSDFDNIYFEIANENYYNEDWELTLCDAIKAYERNLPKQHMTIRRHFPSHSYVVQEWDPETVHKGIMEKRKLKVPLIFDTDWTINENDDQIRKAAWSAIASGGHFNYMDDNMEFRTTPVKDKRAKLHKQIDYMARFVKGIKPWEMIPDDSLVKSGLAFAIANSNTLFAYLPKGGEVTLDLSAMKGNLKVSWYNPLTGKFMDEFNVDAKADAKLNAPNEKDWALLIKAR